MTSPIYFILNDRAICTSQPTGVTVLDHLRLSERITGTKEGKYSGVKKTTLGTYKNR